MKSVRFTIALIVHKEGGTQPDNVVASRNAHAKRAMDDQQLTTGIVIITSNGGPEVVTKARVCAVAGDDAIAPRREAHQRGLTK